MKITTGTEFNPVHTELCASAIEFFTATSKGKKGLSASVVVHGHVPRLEGTLEEMALDTLYANICFHLKHVDYGHLEKTVTMFANENEVLLRFFTGSTRLLFVVTSGSAKVEFKTSKGDFFAIMGVGDVLDHREEKGYKWRGKVYALGGRSSVVAFV